MINLDLTHRHVRILKANREQQQQHFPYLLFFDPSLYVDKKVYALG